LAVSERFARYGVLREVLRAQVRIEFAPALRVVPERCEESGFEPADLVSR
jgi:hypothetical protein